MIDYSQVPSPCYVIDESLLRRNLSIIKDVAEQSGANIILAFKGFAMWSVFPIVKQYIKGTSASSPDEANLSKQEMGVLAHTYSPAYSDDEFDTILNCSSHITFNSFAQYERYIQRVKNHSSKISVGIRVNPEFCEVETQLYNPCAPGSRLGVLQKDMPDMLPKDIEGLHFHVHCESDAEDLQKSLKVFEERFSKYFTQIKWVNFGGGHLMTKKGYNTKLLIEIIRTFKAKYNLDIILEPGSAFAWQTGILVSTVEDIVSNNGIDTAILNVSFTTHMPDCLEMPYKPVITGALEETKGKPTYRMGGCSCLAGDYYGNWSFDKPLTIGDRIVFEDMIHYTMVKTTTFNGVRHPSIGIWNDETGFSLVRKFGYNDYKNRLS